MRNPFIDYKTKYKNIRKKLMPLAVGLIVILLPVTYFLLKNPQQQAKADWYNDGWAYRKKFIVDTTKVSGSTDLANFTVLVSLSSDSDLSANAQADGDDITFTDASGQRLFHEIVSYSAGTLQAWVKLPILYSDEETYSGNVMQKALGTYLGVRNEGTTDLDIYCSLDLSTSDASIQATDAVYIGEWSHVTMTYTDDVDDEISLYINGNLVATSTNGTGNGVVSDSGILYIGGGALNNFDGQIDDVRIYNYELTREQILKIVNEDASVRFGDSPN